MKWEVTKENGEMVLAAIGPKGARVIILAIWDSSRVSWVYGALKTIVAAHNADTDKGVDKWSFV